MLTRKASFLGLVSVFLAGVALGGETIANWSAPATWSPAKAHGPLTAMDVTNPLPFIGLAPCRIVDTRNAPGPYGAPALAGGVPRNFTLPGRCGIPTSAAAASLNVTVTNTQGPGFILIYPQGGSQPTVSTLNYVANQTIANAAVVPLGAGGGITVIAGVSGTDLILDINGYYYDGTTPLTGGQQFKIVANIAGASILGENHSSDGYGVQGNSGGMGVYGWTGGSGLGRAGVWGSSTNAVGTYGGSGTLNGLWGQSTTWDGLAAFGGRDGGFLQGARNGAIGVSIGTTGVLYGLAGITSSLSANAAGVVGIGGSGASAGAGVNGSSGVLGTCKLDIGVVGISQDRGVIGLLFDGTGAFLAEGDLATHAGGVNTYGVWSYGNIGIGSGTKFFVEPHPTDASKVIRYAALEGPESGTYFRGSARTVRGQAVIEVPESFLMVTDDEGLTVQVTPIGDLATMAVASKDLNHVVVRSSKDVTFDYLVQGVRRAFKNLQPIVEGGEFMPRSPEERMPAYLTGEDRSRLIANGTYNQDGTVNMTTAERLGWTKIWANREAEARSGAQKAAAERAQDRQKQ